MSDLAKIWDTPPVDCPANSIGYSYKPFDHHDMHDTLRQARETEPVFYNPELGYWVITRYNDVKAILRDPVRFSAANANTPITPVPPEALQLLRDGGYALEGIQVNCDPPRHTRIRAVASQAMSMKRFVGMEPLIRQYVREGIERLRGRGAVDLMHELTYGLPARVIFSLLGVPADDVPRVKGWAMDRLLLSFSHPTYDQQMDAARNMLAFWQYTVNHVVARSAEPGDDFVSDMLRLRNGDDAVITLNEINSAAFGLLFAGHETTTSQATSTIAAILNEPGLWSRLCGEPELAPKIIDEGLRMFGAVANWRRRAVEDVNVGGVDLPAGSQLLISFAAANRDPEQFPNPDRFIPDRANAHQHLTFGHGIHVCLGAPLARLEIKILLEELPKAFPKMRRMTERPIDYAPAFAFRASFVSE